MPLSLIVTLALCTNAVVILGAIAMWLNYRARSRRAKAAPAIMTELKQLRESVQALMTEVERIGESQRVTARILHEASTMRPTFPAAGAKTVTLN